MTGITIGATPVTGVYVGAQLATGVYFHGERIWPLSAVGFPIGVGAFDLQPAALLVETAQSIGFGAQPLAFTGSRLALGVGGSFETNVGRGSLALNANPFATSAGNGISIGAGPVRIQPRTLAAVLGGAFSDDMVPATLDMSASLMATTAGASTNVAASALAFAAGSLAASIGTGLNVDIGADALQLAASATASAAGAGPSAAAGSMQFEMKPLAPTVSVTLAVAMGTGSIGAAGSALATAVGAPAATWESYDLPGPAHWKGVAYGASTFVAVASDEGATMSSADGVTWTPHSWGGGFPTVSAVFFGGGLFIAAAPGTDQFLSSSDGITWASNQLVLSSTTALNWSCGTYGNGTYLMLASDSGSAVYSTFGTDRNWHYSQVSTAVTNGWSAVVYGDKFVAVASGGTGAATSADGITWTDSTLPISAAWSGIAYGNSTYVAVARDGAIAASSADGATWTQRTLPVSDAWTSIAFGAGLFVAVGGTAGAATSPDGVTWTAGALPTSRGWQSVAFVNGMFVALADDDDVYATSPDGITWTARTIRMRHQWSGVAYGAGKFVVVSNTGSLDAPGATLAAVSADGGITWTRSTLPHATNWNTIAYGGGTFVAVSYGATITDTVAAVSSDGVTWTEHPLPARNNWTMLAYGNGLFLAAARGATFVLTSPDGVTWTEQGLPTAQAWAAQALFTDITFGEGLFKLSLDNFAGSGYDNLICASTADGIAWSVEGAPTGATKYITHDSSRFVAMYTGGSAASNFGDSSHTWQYGSSGAGMLAYGGGTFFGFVEGTTASPDSTVYESTDGQTWTQNTLPRANIWADAVWGDDAMVLLGNPDNRILRLALPAVPISLVGTLPNATAETAYSGTLTLGGDFTWPVTITGLAAWMVYSIKGQTVTVTGTPASGDAGTDTMTVTATDSSATAQVATSSQTVVVNAPAVPVALSMGAAALAITQQALAANVPSITLSATFPSSPHVNDTVSFDVTATLAGGATGTPTVTVDQLPAGISIGATSMVDATHYKATVSGTLTTTQNITSTFGATGGSVAATPLVHTFDVQPAVTTATLVDVGSAANSGTTVNLSVPITVAAGDTILAVMSVRQGATNTGPAGFTQVDDYIAVASSTMGEFLVYTKTADGTETSVDASSNRSFGSAAMQVWKIPGGANIQTFQGGRGGSGAVTAWSVGPFTPAADNSIVIAMWSSGAQLAEGTYGVDAGWDAMTVIDTATSSNLGLASMGWTTQQQTTAAAATANFTSSSGVNNPTDYMIAVSK